MNFYSTKWKWIFGVIGTVFLGAIGSGLWELFLKEILLTLGRWILTGLTFGFSSIRDNLYKEIAQGHNDRVDLLLILVVFYIVSGFCGFYFGRTQSKYDMFRLEALKEDDPAKHDKIAKRLTVNPYTVISVERWFSFIMIFFVSLMMFRFLSLSYIDRAITHYEQSLSICLPYLSKEERDLIRSRYSLIKNKNEYIAVIDTLTATAKNHKVEVPPFTAW